MKPCLMVEGSREQPVERALPWEVEAHRLQGFVDISRLRR